MKTNCFYKIGFSHDVCQDYCIAGDIDENKCFAIVSDGCTMSYNYCKEVDIGARFIVHQTKVLLRQYTDIFSDQTIGGYQFIKNVIPSAINKFRSKLDLSELFCDATLVVAIMLPNNRTKIFFYGDGNAYVKMNNGDEVIIDVNYKSGAPYYLSYLSSQDRQLGYLLKFSRHPLEITTLTTKNGESTKNAKSIESVSEIFFEYEDVDFVTIMSDGIKTYTNNIENKDYVESIREVNNLKNRNGVFVERRMKAMTKKYLKEGGFDNYDDVSVASIIGA